MEKKSKINYFHYISKLHYAAFGNLCPKYSAPGIHLPKATEGSSFDVTSETNVKRDELVIWI